MKTSLIPFLLIISFASSGQKLQTKVIAIGLNSVEQKYVLKQYRIIDSVQNEVNKRWLFKLNEKGYDQSDILKMIPSRRDSLKLEVKVK